MNEGSSVPAACSPSMSGAAAVKASAAAVAPTSPGQNQGQTAEVRGQAEWGAGTHYHDP